MCRLVRSAQLPLGSMGQRLGRLTLWKWLARLLGRDVDTTYQLNEVFTPSQPARLAFVPRPDQEADLRSALDAPGTQALIYGESGAGKSSVALRVLTEMNRKYVVTRCE